MCGGAVKRCLQCQNTFSVVDTCPVCGYTPAEQQGIPIYAPQFAASNDSYPVSVFAQLAKMEAGHFWFEGRNRILSYMAQHYFPQASNVLEVGCGTGYVLQEFCSIYPQAVLTGADIYVKALEFARSRVPTAHFLQMDARDLPFHAEFDLIGAFDVIEHIEEDRQVLSQLYDALVPGGGLLISVPQHRFLWSQVDVLSYHKRRYTRDELQSKMVQAGFEILRTTSFTSLVLPLMLITRFTKKRMQDFDLYAEMRINPGINFLLREIMMVESSLIEASVSFRYGGSRLIVARKKRNELKGVPASGGQEAGQRITITAQGS